MIDIVHELLERAVTIAGMVCKNDPIPADDEIENSLVRTKDVASCSASFLLKRLTHGCEAARLTSVLEIVDDAVERPSGEPVGDGQPLVACEHAVVRVSRYENGNALRDPEGRAVDEHRPFARQAKIKLGRLVSMNVEGSVRREVGNSESDLVRRCSIARNQSAPSQISRLHVAGSFLGSPSDAHRERPRRSVVVAHPGVLPVVLHWFLQYHRIIE